MRVQLLGTGAADGLPNAFCHCATCAEARTSGRIRARSSALVDGRILIDPGPDTALQVSRFGSDLRSADHWLITHGHPDHLDPLLLLIRDWVLGDAPLSIWGPPGALARLDHWLSPTSGIELHSVAPGFRATLVIDDQEYVIRAHRADHVAPPRAPDSEQSIDAMADEALLWSIEDQDVSLLYATDTGPGPSVAAGPYDCVLLDATFGPKLDHGTGHLDFATIGQVLSEWRSIGVIDVSSRVIATHLGHHNPPYLALLDQLTKLGVELHDDGAVLELGRLQRRRTLLTGGMRSGKSSMAEQLARGYRIVHYVATARERDDDEWRERLARHRERRPPHWRTHETSDPVPVLAAAQPGSCVLVDCMSLWLTHVLDDLDTWNRIDERAYLREQVHSAIEQLCEAIDTTEADVICVTNEVGMALVPMDPGSRLFAELLGELSTRLAGLMDRTLLVVAGRAIDVPAPIGLSGQLGTIDGDR